MLQKGLILVSIRFYHFHSSSIGTPRSSATSLNCFIICVALMVARALFSGFLLRSCLPRAFSTPAISNTTLTAPPAITPDPGQAGLNITLAAP